MTGDKRQILSPECLQNLRRTLLSHNFVPALACELGGDRRLQSAVYRLFWTLVVAGSMGMTGWNLYDLGVDYFSYPVSVETKVEW